MGTEIVLALTLLSLILELTSATNVICYHGTWSNYRLGKGKMSINEVPAQYCTHYIYAFVGLDTVTNTVKTLDSWLDIDLNGFKNAIDLKNVNPDLKVLLAIGGWGEGSAAYSAMAASPTSRATLIESAYNIVKQYGFDGFDIDWEYPARRDSVRADDKENFVALLKEFHAKFSPEGLILTAAVSATPSSVDISYDVPSLSQYLDLINVMLYDFHGSWDMFTGHNAPLYPSSRLAGTEYAEYNVDDCVRGWISRGADPAKIALGVPFYGRTNTLTSSYNTAPGASTTGAGCAAGPYTATPGYWGYNEIVEKFNEGGWTQAWDDEQQAAYAYKGNSWLSYDSPESLRLKVNYAKSLGLGGIMLWSVETEDSYAVSGTQYPLLKAISDALADDSGSKTTSSKGPTSSTKTTANPKTSKTTTTTTQKPSSPSDPSAKFSCTVAGYFRDAFDCNKYYFCQSFKGRLIEYDFQCSQGLFYDATTRNCNYPSLVSC